VILVDSSAWTAFFRGREPLAARVDAAIESGEAALCGPVLCELRRGFVSARDRKRTLALLSNCPTLPAPYDVWTEAGELGFELRKKGITVKTIDLVIAVWALTSSVPILTGDGDFRLMQRAGVALALL
jgi:predicted nucleic acid-binding protein